MWFWEKGHSKQMIDSQTGKAEFSQRSKSRSKQTCVVIPFVLTYRLKLRKIAVYGKCKLWKCWNTCYIRMDLLREHVLLHQWFCTTVHRNSNIWFVLSFTLQRKKDVPIILAISNVKFVTTLKRLILSQVLL